MSQLPETIVLHRRDGCDSINSIEDLTCLPTPGFSPITETPGGDVALLIFDNEDEAQSFKEGFEYGTPGDDTTWAVETFDGRDEAVMIVHFGDSSDDEIRVEDKRSQSLKQSV